MKHLIISSGGTGGHFYPGLAIAREFAARGNRVTFLVSGQQSGEQKAIAEDAGFAAREIPSVRAPRTMPDILRFPLRFWKCCRAVRGVYRELQADALLSMGSFTSVAPCWCWRGKPLFLHEGNTVMGQANRIFAARASAIALTLPLKNSRQLKGTPSRLTGMPLRENILEAAKNPPSPEKRNEILKSFGLSPLKTTLLVFGGSQGARAIIDLLAGALPLLSRHNNLLQLIVLTGTDDNKPLQQACDAAGIQARIVRKDPEIQRCYQVADAVICRAGASSICELALFRKPSLLIPLPTAKDNHQFHNASCLAKAKAAVLLTQSETTPDILANRLENWLDNPDIWEGMPHAIGQFARPCATAEVVEMIQEILEKPAKK